MQMNARDHTYNCIQLESNINKRFKVVPRSKLTDTAVAATAVEEPYHIP